MQINNMQDILNKISDYNSVLFDIDNSPDWDTLNIPYKLIEKQTKIHYEIYKSIIDYCINNNHLNKPVEIIINNIHNNFFKINDKPIDLQLFKNTFYLLI